MSAPGPRYELRTTLGERGFVRTHGLVDTADGSRRVGLSLAGYLDVAERKRRLAAVRAAHRRAAGDGVPDVVDMFEGTTGEVLVLGSEACLDGAALLTRLEARGVRFPPDVAAAMLERIVEILVRVHELAAEPSDGPLVLGVLEPRNLLVRPDGDVELVGFGLAPWALDNCPLVPVAPEIGQGRPLTTKVDVFATFCFAQSVARYLEFAPTLERAHYGGTGPIERKLRVLIEAGNRAIWGVPPELRPSAALGMSMWRRLWTLSGVKPDRLALRHFLVEHGARSDSEATSSVRSPLTWRVAADASWVQAPDGHRVDLRRRLVARRLLLQLVDAHEAGRPATIWSLAEAAWPDERIAASAIPNRVYVAVSRLRGSGLAALVESAPGDAGGYRIRPGLTVLRG